MGNLFARHRSHQSGPVSLVRPAEPAVDLVEPRTVRLWLMDSAEPVTERAEQARAEQLFEESRSWPNAAAAELVGDDDDVLDRW